MFPLVQKDELTTHRKHPLLKVSNPLLLNAFPWSYQEGEEKYLPGRSLSVADTEEDEERVSVFHADGHMDGRELVLMRVIKPFKNTSSFTQCITCQQLSSNGLANI